MDDRFDRLAAAEARFGESKAKLVRTIYWLVALVVCLIVSPLLLVPLAIAWLLWQVIDVMHRRAKRKRHEQETFLRLSGRGSLR